MSAEGMGPIRTWTLAKLAVNRNAPELIKVIELEPVLDLLKRCHNHEWKLPEHLWRDIDALLREHGRQP